MAKEIKIKEFHSKYPFKQESRGDKEVIWEGSVEQLNIPVWEKHLPSLIFEPGTKFIIIYKPKDYAKKPTQQEETNVR